MITNESYIEQYRELHRRGRYGATSEKIIARILPEVLELRPRSILDYGCGQSRLIELLEYEPGVELFRYDPAIPEYAVLPVTQVDLVINTDVMEHVPPDDVDDVLSHIQSISTQAVFNIATAPAQATLPSGENAHCTVRSSAWWRERLECHFDHVETLSASRPTKCLFKTWPSQPHLWLAKRYWFVQESLKRRLRVA